jgi:hypothetical protein
MRLSGSSGDSWRSGELARVVTREVRESSGGGGRALVRESVASSTGSAVELVRGLTQNGVAEARGLVLMARPEPVGGRHPRDSRAHTTLLTGTRDPRHPRRCVRGSLVRRRDTGTRAAGAATQPTTDRGSADESLTSCSGSPPQAAAPSPSHWLAECPPRRGHPGRGARVSRALCRRRRR